MSANSCPHCGKEAKSVAGLAAHVRSHKVEVLPEVLPPAPPVDLPVINGIPDTASNQIVLQLDGDEIKVWQNKRVVRIYSLAVHGEGYKALAECFVGKHNR